MSGTRLQTSPAPVRGSQTITQNVAPEVPILPSGTLRLRGHHTNARRVAWTDNTIDNEKLGRKSSKICCIYHKPKNYDESSSGESSSSSDSDDTGDEHDSAAHRNIKRKKKSNDHHEHDGPCEKHQTQKQRFSGSSSSESSLVHNAYEKGLKQAPNVF